MAAPLNNTSDFDLQKRRMAAREPLRKAEFPEPVIEDMERSAARWVDTLSAAGYPPEVGVITALLVLHLVHERSDMSPQQLEEYIRAFRPACKEIAHLFVQSLELAKRIAWNTKARRVMGAEDAWETLGKASERDLTEG